ncbi:MAG: gamma-glutamyl kinase [Pseudomonadota bacterium]
MLVFWKEKLVLLSVPKTGTSALEAALRDRADAVFENPPELKHVPMFRYNRFLKPLFGVLDAERRFETMAIIREPVSWLGSWYRYRSRAELAGRPNSTAEMTFDRFVRAYMDDPRPPCANVGSPRKFVSNGQGKIAVKHLFQYEELGQAAAFLEDRLGVTVELEARNVSPKRSLELDPETYAALRRTCADEFDLWQTARRT